MMITRKTCNMMLVCFCLKPNKSRSARRGTTNNTPNSSCLSTLNFITARARHSHSGCNAADVQHDELRLWKNNLQQNHGDLHRQHHWHRSKKGAAWPEQHSKEFKLAFQLKCQTARRTGVVAEPLGVSADISRHVSTKRASTGSAAEYTRDVQRKKPLDPRRLHRDERDEHVTSIHDEN